MDSRTALRLVALGTGGAVAVPAFLGISSGIIGYSSLTTAIGAAVAAGIAAAIADRSRWLEGGAIAGLIMIAIHDFFTIDQTVEAIGAVVLLGCLVALAKDAQAQACLVVGALIGVVASNATIGIPQVWQLILIAIAVGTLLAAQWPANRTADSSTFAICAGLPFVILLVQSLPDALLVRVAVALAVIAAAFLLPGRSGLVLLAGAAISGIAPYIVPSALGFLIVIGLFVGAAVLGLRRPQTVVGIGALAIISTPIVASVPGSASLIGLAAAFAGAYAISSSLAAPPPALAIALALPALMFTGDWTAYTPLTTGDGVLRGDWIPSLILAAYAGSAYFLSRRSWSR